MSDTRPQPPLSDLQAAAGDDPHANAALGEFHAEYSRERPDAAVLAQHAERLRATPSLVATFEGWWLDPHVQAFIAELNATGI